MPDREETPGQTDLTVCPFFVVLSGRQAEVLGLAALGCTDSEIAQLLTLSVYTVQDHLRAARERLQARNTTHAVALGLLTGQIDVDDLMAQAISGMSASGGGEGGRQ
jgi:DNA-binding CsgD family transcriptional regulator